MVGPRDDRRQRGFWGPRVDPRRWHLRHAYHAHAPVLQRRVELRGRRELGATRPVRAVGAPPIPRSRCFRRSDVGPGGLEPEKQKRRLVFRRWNQLVRAAQYAMETPARRQRVCLRQLAVDGRRQQHGTGRLEIAARVPLCSCKGLKSPTTPRGWAPGSVPVRRAGRAAWCRSPWRRYSDRTGSWRPSLRPR